MGKNTDKLYITHSEHAEGSGHSASSQGARAKAVHNFARLPFDCCALSLQPFDLPVATADGICYDLLNIVPYLKKHGTDPVTGKKLASGDLVKLNFSKNADGNYHDPLTFRVFTQHTPIVAIKTSGNVFAKDSVDRLNVKAAFWRDLVSDEPFTRADIIVLQDPHNPDQRDLSKFKHLDADLKPTANNLPDDSLSGINVNATGGASGILKSINAKGKEKQQDSIPQEVVPTPEASTSKSLVHKEEVEPWNASKFTTGHTAASLTSTAVPIFTKTERALYDEDELMFEAIKEKAYVKLKTNFGDLNVELFCDKAPRTCYNFLMLARERKYDNTIFHRLIAGFMLQGGDPTGTGKGGESYWGKDFADEYMLKNAYKHEARGMLSMANHGANTNGSQFFFTFRETPHLDGKHTVFGKIVGGQEALDKMEKIPANPANDRPTRPIRLIDVSIFKDPYEDYKSKLSKRLERDEAKRSTFGEKKRLAAEREKDRTTWFGTQLGQKGDDLVLDGLGGVGKYLGKGKTGEKRKEGDLNSLEPEVGNAAAAKRKKKAGGFGDFSGW